MSPSILSFLSIATIALLAFFFLRKTKLLQDKEKANLLEINKLNAAKENLEKGGCRPSKQTREKAYGSTSFVENRAA